MSVSEELASNSITALITAVATIITAVGGLLAYILPKLKTQNAELEKVREAAITGANAATFAARGVIENQEKIKTAIDVGVKVSGTEQELAKVQPQIEALAKDLELKRKQLERLLEMVPKQANIDSVADFPR